MIFLLALIILKKHVVIQLRELIFFKHSQLLFLPFPKRHLLSPNCPTFLLLTKTEIMNDIVNFCDRCGKPIPTGSAYVCLTRNIEQVQHCITTNEDEIEIIESEMLIALCGYCGNKFNADTLVKLIHLIPDCTKEINEN